VALELDVDDRRQRLARRLLRHQRHVGGEGAGLAQPAQAARDRRRRAADLFGQAIGGLKVVELQQLQQVEVEPVELLPHWSASSVLARQKLASFHCCLREGGGVFKG
jgi:hypothetical protein